MILVRMSSHIHQSLSWTINDVMAKIEKSVLSIPSIDDQQLFKRGGYLDSPLSTMRTLGGYRVKENMMIICKRKKSIVDMDVEMEDFLTAIVTKPRKTSKL